VRRPEPQSRALLLFLLLLGALASFRAWFNGAVPLTGEEAYYWSWSKYLDLSYFDHPPLIAWTIWLVTAVFGDTAGGVRAAALILHIAAAGIVYHLARRTFGDRTTAAWAGALFTTAFFFGVTACIMIPDGPLFFCWALALWLVLRAIRPGGERWWPAAGAALGLCALAKFHAILLAVAVGLLLVCSPRQRRQFRSGWLYLGAVVALLMCAPVLVWNAQNGWPTFGYQLAGRHDRVLGDPTYLCEMILAPFGYVGLVTYPLCVAGAVWGLRRRRDDLLLLSLAWLVPVAFFGLLSAFIRMDAQWAAPGYVSGVVLAAGLGAQLRAGEGARCWKRALLPAAVAVGGGLLLAAHCAALVVYFFPQVVPAGDIRILSYRRKSSTKVLDEFFGWEEVGQRLRQEIDRLGGPERAFILCRAGQGTASSLRFYTPGHPRVFLFKEPPIQGKQFYIWERRARLSGQNAVIVGRKPEKLDLERMRRMFEAVEEAPPIRVVRAGRLRQRFLVFRGRAFRGDSGP